MWILLFTIWSVTLLNGQVEPLAPPITMVVKEFKTFAECNERLVATRDDLIASYPNETYGKAHNLECKLIRRIQ